MSILIKGMEMPAQGEFKHIRIYDNGDVTVEVEGGEAVIAHASTVPPHGRLIEESNVLDIVSDWCPDDDGSVGKDGDLREMLDEIEALPTIIPAEENNNDR